MSALRLLIVQSLGSFGCLNVELAGILIPSEPAYVLCQLQLTGLGGTLLWLLSPGVNYTSGLSADAVAMRKAVTLESRLTAIGEAATFTGILACRSQRWPCHWPVATACSVGHNSTLPGR
jgi:hypothetical protein